MGHPGLEIGNRKFDLSNSACQVANCRVELCLKLAQMGFYCAYSRLYCLHSRGQCPGVTHGVTHLRLHICEKSDDVPILHCERAIYVDVANELSGESITLAEDSHA